MNTISQTITKPVRSREHSGVNYIIESRDNIKLMKIKEIVHFGVEIMLGIVHVPSPQKSGSASLARAMKLRKPSKPCNPLLSFVVEPYINNIHLATIVVFL